MTDPMNLPEGAGHTTPSLPSPKERGVPAGVGQGRERHAARGYRR